MTEKKKPTKSTKPSWSQLAGASKVKLDEKAVNGDGPTPAPTTPAKDTEPVKYSTITHAALSSKWPQLATRVRPEVKDAYTIHAELGGRGAGRAIVEEALNDWFVKQGNPVNDYVRDLIEKAKKD